MSTTAFERDRTKGELFYEGPVRDGYNTGTLEQWAYWNADGGFSVVTWRRRSRRHKWVMRRGAVVAYPSYSSYRLAGFLCARKEKS